MYLHGDNTVLKSGDPHPFFGILKNRVNAGEGEFVEPGRTKLINFIIITIVTHNTVLRAHPQVAIAILFQCLNLVFGQTFLYADMVKLNIGQLSTARADKN